MSLAESTRERIATLVSSGIAHNVVASAVGISAGRLSQLLESDNELAELIAKEAAIQADKDVLRIKNLRTIEGRIVAKLPELVDECSSLREGVQALAAITDMRRTMAGLTPKGSTGIGAGVQLNLSAIAQMQINVVLTEKNTIMELGGQSVLPMPRAKVEEFLREPDPVSAQLAEEDDDADY